MRPVAQDPFPSQIQDDVQPDPIEVDGNVEYSIEAIIDTKIKKNRERDSLLRREFLVK